MNGVVVGCWAGAICAGLHVLMARWGFAHWPTLARVGVTFGTVVAFVSMLFALWPILFDANPTTIQCTSEIVLALWLGMLAMAGVTGLTFYDNWGDLERRKAEQGSASPASDKATS